MCIGSCKRRYIHIGSVGIRQKDHSLCNGDFYSQVHYTPPLNLDVSEILSNMQFETEENSTAAQLDYTLKAEYEHFLTSDIEKCLLNEGITVKSVEVQYESAQDEAEIMHITKILVYTSGPINKNKYENLLKELYDTDVSILREEENQKEN